jgi:hypothetical protein
MTPEAGDLLRGARRTLSDVVLPALTDAFAIEQVKTVLRILTHLEAVIDEAYPLEAAETEDLCRFLGEVARSATTLAPLGEPDEREPLALEPFRELRDGNVRRKAKITAVIRALARAPKSPELEAIRTALDRLAARQLERERRWTNPRRKSK